MASDSYSSEITQEELILLVNRSLSQARVSKEPLARAYEDLAYAASVLGSLKETVEPHQRTEAIEK